MSRGLMQVSKRIPRNVIDALWFADGDLKNYVPTNAGVVYQDDFFKISFPCIEEPSLIYSTAPIGKVICPAPALGYYPSYSNLTPNERATYLNWLCNIETEIEIGYVFIFYYGLERWLMFGDDYHFKNAFELILKLRKYHKNASLQSYSSEAVMFSAVAKNKLNCWEDILVEDFKLTPITLAYLAYTGFYLEARHIVKLASAIGFKNRRYIKDEPNLFLEVLKDLLGEKYSKIGYRLNKEILTDSPQIKTSCFANYSLNRECLVPDITQSPKFRKDLGKLLTAAHEKLKLVLKGRRKVK